VLAEKEGKDIAACLGNKKAALLQNHGLLTVGKTIEEVRRLECDFERSDKRAC
jgi:ribulose-5-phosphate 4-epimerase/fuculose-1-phosphate aldolase